MAKRHWWLIGMLLTGCGTPTQALTTPAASLSTLATAASTPTLAATVPPGLSGTIALDGSSTVYPIAELIAREFQAQAPAVTVQIGVSGTSGGFKRFCTSATMLSNASRPIKASEMEQCAANGVEFIEVPIAFDGISVVVPATNTWASCMTVDELRRLWEPAAEATLTQWDQLRPEWPATPINLYGAGADSGTFDYFTTAIVGAEDASRADYIGSEDDYLLAQDIAADPAALGYFGYAYYREYADQLRLVAVDAGAGCVAPTPATIADATYQPLARPMFLYINRDALSNHAVAAFVDYFLTAAPGAATAVRYVPLPERAYALGRARIAQRLIGSLFDGGPQIGVSIEQLLDMEGR